MRFWGFRLVWDCCPKACVKLYFLFVLKYNLYQRFLLLPIVGPLLSTVPRILNKLLIIVITKQLQCVYVYTRDSLKCLNNLKCHFTSFTATAIDSQRLISKNINVVYNKSLFWLDMILHFAQNYFLSLNPELHTCGSMEGWTTSNYKQCKITFSKGPYQLNFVEHFTKIKSLTWEFLLKCIVYDNSSTWRHFWGR